MVALQSKRSNCPIRMLPQKCCLGNVASEMLPQKDLKTLGLLLRCPNIASVTAHPFRIDPYKFQRRCYLFLNSGIALSKGKKE